MAKHAYLLFTILYFLKATSLTTQPLQRINIYAFTACAPDALLSLAQTRPASSIYVAIHATRAVYDTFSWRRR